MSFLERVYPDAMGGGECARSGLLCVRWRLGAALLGIGGCTTLGGQGPPRHYDDPQQMIEVFEDDTRESWQMPLQVLRVIPIPSKGAVVADIGAGSGYFTRRLAAEVPEGRVYAVDVDGQFEEYLLANREAWGTPNIEPHLAHYDDPMLPARSVDVVFTANTYAYIRNRVEYFTKVHATLKPGGTLVVIDFRPDATAPTKAALDAKHRVDKNVAVGELTKAGFSVVRDEEFLPHQWFLVLSRQ